tara:strand:+ start:2115 stop:2768 length:654 start_codon:yes stop_codon:yes gene_type:complete
MKSKFEFNKVSPGWHYDTKIKQGLELSCLDNINLSDITKEKVSNIIEAPYREGGIKRIHIGDTAEKVENKIIDSRIAHMREVGYKSNDYFIEFINDKFLELEKTLSIEYDIEYHHACAIYLEPGQCMPVHDDTYAYLQKYMKRDYPEVKYDAVENIRRYLVFLTDWEWGQCLGAGNTIEHQWTAGDVYAWKHKMLHWSSNSSMKPMAFFEITGLWIQ